MKPMDGGASVEPTPVADAAAPPLKLLVEPVRYTASIHAGPDKVLPDEFVGSVLALEKVLEMPMWLFVQSAHGHGKYEMVDHSVVEGFIKHLRARVKKCVNGIRRLPSPSIA